MRGWPETTVVTSPPVAIRLGIASSAPRPAPSCTNEKISRFRADRRPAGAHLFQHRRTLHTSHQFTRWTSRPTARDVDPRVSREIRRFQCDMQIDQNAVRATLHVAAPHSEPPSCIQHRCHAMRIAVTGGMRFRFCSAGVNFARGKPAFEHTPRGGVRRRHWLTIIAVTQ
jgi:hypothetical protein